MCGEENRPPFTNSLAIGRLSVGIMRSRIEQLYEEYCIPKPRCFVRVYDTELVSYPETDKQESDSIDIFVNILVWSVWNQKPQYWQSIM